MIEGDAEFFSITKRVHNRLHGAPGDGHELGEEADMHYRSVLEANGSALAGRVEPGDVVLLHDPQTAGLAGHLARRGARVVWRCHIGTDRANAQTQEAWRFLLPHLRDCHSYVFSRAAFVPPELTEADVWVIEPSIDPLSPKNRALPQSRVTDLLQRIGLLEGADSAASQGVLGGAGPFSPADRVVVQVPAGTSSRTWPECYRGSPSTWLGARRQLALVAPRSTAWPTTPRVPGC